MFEILGPTWTSLTLSISEVVCRLGSLLTLGLDSKCKEGNESTGLYENSGETLVRSTGTKVDRRRAIGP